MLGVDPSVEPLPGRPSSVAGSGWRRIAHGLLDRWCRLLPHRRVWLFGSWGGLSYSDNARYLYEYVCDHQHGIEAVWVTRDPRKAPRGPRRRWVLYGSRRARALERIAEAVLYTYEYHDALFREPRDILTVQLWHGMPLKKIGLDVESKPRDHGRHDLTIATSEEFARIIAAAFGLPRPSVEVTGLPRNDVLVRPRSGRLAKALGHRRVVLYMPTYREGFPLLERMPAAASLLGNARLQQVLEAHSACLIVKEHNGHQLWAAPSRIDLAGHLIPFESLDMDVQEVLGEADILMTDYSSCYIDYLLCDRPILFYCHDLESYRSERGFYFDYASVTPGPRASSADEIIDRLGEALAGKDEHAQERARLRMRFFRDTDGRSCERVYAAVRARVEKRR